MMDEPAQTLDAYFRLMNLNGASHIYRTAKQAGMFAALAANAGTAAQVAERSHLAESPTRLVLETLRVLGLVSVDREVYSLTPLARMLLAGSYQNLSDEYWAHLPHFLKTGEPLKTMDNVQQSEMHYQAHAAAMAWMFGPASTAAVRLLGIGAERKNLNIVDVGAGSAIWSLAIASHDAGSRVTAVDWPAVLAVAKAMAEQRHLAGQLTLLPGNFNEVALPPAAFDLAIVANVTHLLSPKANAALFRKLHHALKPAGELLVIDVFPSEAGALSHALYVLGLALRTSSARPLSREELTHVMSDVGFGIPEFHELPAPPHVLGMLIAARKEAGLFEQV